MVTEIIAKIVKADPFFGRNILKTVSWRLVGSIDTAILGWIITGNLSFGAKIGAAELFTKMVLYYGHERLWQTIKFGFPSKKNQKDIAIKNKPYLFRQIGKIARSAREDLNNHQAFTLWLTGLSGSGKSTLAVEIEYWLFNQSARAYILDGDNTRLGINSDLSFSDDDRSENIRRVAEICKLFNDAGTIVIASFISPFKNDRILAKEVIGEDSYVEVFVDSNIEVCRMRDVKGLYQLADQGKLKNFTGVNSPYEAPVCPDIYLDTGSKTVEECLLLIQQYLFEHQFIFCNNNSLMQIKS